MKQYNQIKAKYPDALLLFRVGDFYETFGEDAVKASKILGIIQTKRGAGSSSETELAGFPHHALNTYLPKLVKAGCRVAICDQLEDPKMTKTIVKRGVTELITPGVALNDDVLEQKKNNYLAAVHQGKKSWGVAFLDISTGDFFCSEGDNAHVQQLLEKFQPSEVLVPKPMRSGFSDYFGTQFSLFFLEDWVFQIDFCSQLLLGHFNTQTLKGFGIEKNEAGQLCAGAILHYLAETHHKDLKHITKITPLHSNDFMGIDAFTARNLELLYPSHREGKALIDVIDHTLTAMGGRLLKNWISFPLISMDAILFRQKGVEAFVSDGETLEAVRKQIKTVSDVERIMSKIATQKISPRELVQLKHSLGATESLKKLLAKTTAKPLQQMGNSFPDSTPIISSLEDTLQEEAPVNLNKGNVIAEGFSKELDELRGLRSSGQQHLDAMLARETERTEIPSLKIAFNNVFGYYIEVRNTHKDKVPEAWVRKQTLVNAERYITEELKEYETKILGAEEKIQQLELHCFETLVHQLQAHLADLKTTALSLSTLDCIQGFAQLAQKHDYHAPTLEPDSKTLEITAGRHPVIEQQLPLGTAYIDNDVHLGSAAQQIIMITGPNMSGKSALLRQTALIVLLAQVGSFVPAKAVKMGVVDRIFTRVGASDNLSMGESTFMVEMNESASILNNITSNSLVLLDEIGRGTSTYDGISIAWAIAEYLHQHPAQPKTLFATHYHELNEMTQKFERIKNYNVAVKEMKNDVLFLRKLQAGGSAHSFGLHVAKMAGMPSAVLRSAEKKLALLEKTHATEDRKEALKNSKEEMQLSFISLDDPLLEDIKADIMTLDINTLTPVEALMKLHGIKGKLGGKSE